MTEELKPVYYMRDDHTFKLLSGDVDTAIVEIEGEFNAGYTCGMLCSKRPGFKNIHAQGDENRFKFFAECKKALESAITAAPTPPAQTGIRAEFLDAHIKRTTNTVGRMVAETADQRGADAVAEFVRRAMQHVVSLIDATPPAQPAVPEDVARDAERYRWLRSRPLDWSVEHHTNGWSTCYGLMELDAAIDAARAAEKGGA